MEIKYCECSEEEQVPYEDGDGKTWCNNCIQRIKNVKDLKTDSPDEQIKGTVEVCCHRVKYNYEVEQNHILTAEAESIDLKEGLEAEAETRAKDMINDGYVSGELNYVLNGEEEIRGWWSIDTD